MKDENPQGKSEGVLIKELLEYWLDYAKTEAKPELSGFSKWLFLLLFENPDESFTSRGEALASQNGTTLDFQIGYLFGRLTRYSEMLGKKTFRGLVIRSFEEYSLLKNIDIMGNPPKSELARASLMENSTCFEMINRMKKHGLLRDEVDESDKRSRRVSLSEQGKEVMDLADQRANLASRLLVGLLKNKDKSELLNHLIYLNEFHEKIHQEHGAESLDDLIKLLYHV